MSMRSMRPFAPFLLSGCCLLSQAVQAANEGSTQPVLELEPQSVIATAKEETKQAPGVSVITAEDIQKRPPANDLSQIIRTMPGSTSPVTPPAASAATTGRSTSAAWARKTP
ncbi:hypothetical protein PBOI14_34070 [Pseudomonas sp. Boi14]|nr:hypothetical protein PBOI14_34070 [Pseudomonas sp. Boi14]